MPLIFNSSLYVVIACFLHIIKMMVSDGRLLEILKTIYHNSISLWKWKELTPLKSWKRLRGHLLHQPPPPQAVLQKGDVNTQYEATGHTNLFFNLFHFSSKHLCRQSKKTSYTLVILSFSQSPKAAEYCQSVADFPVLSVCNDALNWNKIDWKTNWYAHAFPAVLY